MTELWIKKSTTDVHRKIDNKLPKGSVCSGVTMIAHEDGVEEFTAIINGEEVNVEGPPEASADEIADEIVAGAPAPHPPPAEPATTQNAQVEGAEITEADEAMGGPGAGRIRIRRQHGRRRRLGEKIPKKPKL